MSSTLTINRRPYRLAVVNGLPHINGLPVRDFLAKLRRQPEGKMALGQLLAAARMLTTQK